MPNLTNVISFEFFRTITKKRFWIMTLGVPVLLGLIFALSYASGKSSAPDPASTGSSFTYHDASGVVEKSVAERMGGREVTDVDAAIQDVKQGRSDAFFDIPADPTSTDVRVFGRDRGLVANSQYSTLAVALLQTSASQRIGDPLLSAVAADKIPTTTTAFRPNGEVAPGFMSVILPGAFVVLLYLSIVMLGNQMLNVTLEEKENRVSEMILTTMNPHTLIEGKVIALVGVGILQMLVFAVPLVVAWVWAPSLLSLPGFSLSSLTVDWLRIGIGAALFLASFAMFTGCLVAVGSVMPTAKEASQAFAVVMVGMFVPLYAVQMLVTNPNALLPTVFTYFPLTAPISAMVRNATGNLVLWQAMVVLLILAVTASVMLALGVRLFRTGAIQYDSKVNVRAVLRRG